MNGFMGGIVGGAVVRLFLDSTQFNQAWKTSEQNAKAGAANISGSYSKMGVAANAAFLMAQAAVVSFVAAGVRAALEYEKVFTRINAISNASATDIARWRDQTLEISNATGIAAQELAQALYFLSSSGLDANQIMPTLEASAQAAAVGLGNTADIAKITAQALNAYAGSSLTAAQVTDTLVAAVREGSADPEEFAEALGRILPVASAAGIEFNEVTASLAALSNIGLDVNEGVTAMRGLFTALIAPTASAAKAMDDLGISTESMRQTIKEEGVIVALNQLWAATGQNLDAMKRIIPNVRALTGALGILGQDSTKVSDIFKATLDSTGALGTAFQETAQSPAFALQQSMTKIANAGMEIGISLVPVLDVLAKALGVAADNAGLLLTLLVGYKALGWLPGLFQQVAGGIVAMNGAMGAAAAHTVAYANAAAGASLALRSALPVIGLMAAALAALQAMAKSAADEMARLVKNAPSEIAGAADDPAGLKAKIDAMVAEFEAAAMQPPNPLSPDGWTFSDLFKMLSGEGDSKQETIAEQSRQYRYYLRSLALEAQEAAAIQEQSLVQFARNGGKAMRELTMVADVLGVSYGDLAAEAKAALSDTEDRQAAWVNFVSETMGKAEQAMMEWKDATVASLSFVDDSFKELASSGEGSITAIISKLRESLAAQKQFNENLEVIAERARQYGVDASEIIQTFIDTGPEAAATVEAVANAGEAQFREVLGLMDESQSNARSTARELQEAVVGTLEQIRAILEAIARKWGVKIDVQVDRAAFDRLMNDLIAAGLGRRAFQLRQEAAGGNLPLANGGVIAGARGFVTRGATYLVGEGAYSTRFGMGAEAVLPLNEMMLRRLGTAIGQHTAGSSSRIVNTTINVAGKVERPEDISRSISWWTRAQGL